MDSSKINVAIFASAIRTNLWKRLYDRLSATNNCTFKLFFCGHIRPNFEMPSNFVYIYSTMNAAPCVEIAYRHAMKENSDYIMNLTDDCWDISPNLLDTLIKEIEEDDKELITGPSFRNGLNADILDLHIVTDDHSSPLVPCFPMMRRSTAERIGGLDKRFEALYWDCDRIFRAHRMDEIKISVCDKVEISEDKPPGRDVPVQGTTIWKKWRHHDRNLLDGLWSWWPMKRVDAIQSYHDGDLCFEPIKE